MEHAERPRKVTVIAVIAIISGIGALLSAPYASGYSSFAIPVIPVTLWRGFCTVLLRDGLISPAFPYNLAMPLTLIWGIVSISCGMGILRGSRSSSAFYVWGVGLAAMTNLLLFTRLDFVAMAYWGITAWILSRPDARAFLSPGARPAQQKGT